MPASDLEWLRKRTEERAHWDRISTEAEVRRKARREGHAVGIVISMISSTYRTRGTLH